MIKKPAILMVGEGIVNSYAQIFFSLDKIVGLVLLLCTFFNPVLGLSGLFCVILSNAMATALGYNKEHIREGLFGFNAILLGLALGFDYKPTPMYWAVLTVACIVLILNQVWISGVLTKYGLPSLSFPFLITIWIVVLALRQTHLLELVEHNIYLLNEQKLAGGTLLNTLELQAHSFSLPHIIESYFKSLGGVFFQNNLVCGILVGAVLLYHSRIAFSLTLLAFVWAWVCIEMAGTDLEWMRYQAGANFIFLAIAVGCFFVIPSVYSYLAVLLLVPVTIFAHLFFTRLLGPYYLPAYTVAFSFVTVAFVYLLRARAVHKYIYLTAIQYYSPEKTVYKEVNTISRYKKGVFKHIGLPFWGDWFVSQGHDGKITHLGPWAKAWDFIILDNEMKPYMNEGLTKEEYYCYNKPVLAPADGYVATVTEYIDDNPLAGMDLVQNWGNSVVINHGDGLYSQLSHLKKDSIKVRVGDYIKQGDVVASVGNSGRSPEPHIHFQLQKTPEVGAKTEDYPLAYYLVKDNGNQKFVSFERPKEGQIISNITPTALLAKAFGLLPGMKFTYTITRNKLTVENMWEVFTDAYNRTYIYCHTTESYAYFVNDGTLFYFTDFEGDRQSALYIFYLAAYKTLLGYTKDLVVGEEYPLTDFGNRLAMALQDFIAPFYRFVKVKYTAKHAHSSNEFAPDKIEIESAATVKFIGQAYKQNTFKITVENDRVQTIEAIHNKQKITVQCV